MNPIQFQLNSISTHLNSIQFIISSVQMNSTSMSASIQIKLRRFQFNSIFHINSIAFNSISISNRIISNQHQFNSILVQIKAMNFQFNSLHLNEKARERDETHRDNCSSVTVKCLGKPSPQMAANASKRRA